MVESFCSHGIKFALPVVGFLSVVCIQHFIPLFYHQVPLLGVCMVTIGRGIGLRPLPGNTARCQGGKEGERESRASVRTSGLSPAFGRSSDTCNRFVSDAPALASDSVPTNPVPPPATDPAPVTMSDHPQLNPHLGCAPDVKPAALLPSPRRHPRRPLVIRRALSQPHPFPWPNISSPLQQPSDHSNIYAIYY